MNELLRPWGALFPFRWVACGDHKVEDKVGCGWRARQRTPTTHNLVEKDSLRRSRTVYVRIAPTAKDAAIAKEKPCHSAFQILAVA